MTSDVHHPPKDDRNPPDILELGMALVSATPRLKHSLRGLTSDSERARRLTEAALREAWYARDQLPGNTDVYGLLLKILRANVLH
jgi:DNA-directed RNA polymerase specialized sigma24 family protein